MDLGLKGKVAIVTGGGSGIGRSTALLFSQEGAKVIVGDISDDNGIETTRMIQDKGGESLFVRIDVSRKEEAERMVRIALDRFERVDILANIAGTPAKGGLLSGTVEDWDDIFAVHVRGTFNCTRAVLPHMMERRYGKIINMGSFCAYGMIASASAYAAAKGAILTYTKGLAKDVARCNINVNSVSPGNIFTPMTVEWMGTGKKKDKFATTIPIGRVGEAEDVASVIVFLASDKSRHITGVDIIISGGQLIH